MACCRSHKTQWSWHVLICVCVKGGSIYLPTRGNSTQLDLISSHLKTYPDGGILDQTATVQLDTVGLLDQTATVQLNTVK